MKARRVPPALNPEQYTFLGHPQMLFLHISAGTQLVTLAWKIRPRLHQCSVIWKAFLIAN
jgi:hypothetical protein